MIPERLQPLLAPESPSQDLARLFADAGHQLFLVGGTVRDAFMDRKEEGTDLDFATDARPDEIRRIVDGWAHDVYTAGQAFGTVGAVRGDQRFEITTFRREVYRDESRKPFVEFADDIKTDLSRRDFTVNAVALRLPEAEVVDPHGGLTDLAGAVLRTPLDPHISFGDDPLRMLRLFRFQATLGFRPDPAAVAAVKSMRHRLAIVSRERIREELTKLLTAPKPSTALAGLVESGLMDEFLPEIPALAVEQDPVHQHKDILQHTLAVVDKTRPDLEVRLAALLHDIGKPDTRRIDPYGVSFHHHEVVGARMARDRLRALRFPKHIVTDVSELVRLHLRPHTFKMGWTDRAVRRYVRDAGPLLDDLNHLVRCDVTTRNRARARQIEQRIDELEAAIADLREREELERLRPPIDGHRVMEYLGIPPGPTVGEVMRMLTEHRIDHGPYDEEEALALVDAWARDKGLTRD